MKKIFLGALSLLLCVALCGCGSSSTSSAISSLSNQLDQTANTISSVETVSPTALGTKSDNLSSTQNALMREEWNKAQILSRTAEIKQQLSEDTSLSKEEISAVKELTNNLNKYTLSVAYTKNDLDSTLKSINSLSKNEEKNAEKLDAKLNRLTCSSNARATYYENILSTLDQIDAYLSSQETEETEEADYETEEKQQINPQAPQFAPNSGYNSNNINRAAYGGMGYGGFGGYGGYGDMTYGGVNSYNMANNPNGMGYMQNIGGMTGTPFNINRNTDTYAPLVRNVDTYRPVESEKRIEEYEEIAEDNTLQEAEEATETWAKVRLPHEHTIEESENFVTLDEHEDSSQNNNRMMLRHTPHKKPQRNEDEAENLSSENVEQETQEMPPRPQIERRKFPRPTNEIQHVSNDVTENSEEKKVEEIQSIEPQAKLSEVEPRSTIQNESKIKSVSTSTQSDEHEEWDLPIQAH